MISCASLSLWLLPWWRYRVLFIYFCPLNLIYSKFCITQDTCIEIWTPDVMVLGGGALEMGDCEIGPLMMDLSLYKNRSKGVHLLLLLSDGTARIWEFATWKTSLARTWYCWNFSTFRTMQYKFKLIVSHPRCGILLQ